MNDTTVHTLPTRRRDDNTPPQETARRSSPAFAVQLPADLPMHSPVSVKQFPDSVAANARAERLRQANAAQARRMEAAMQTDKLRRRELASAREEAFDKGEESGYREGWYWGLGTGVAIGGSIVWLCIKAGIYVALRA